MQSNWKKILNSVVYCSGSQFPDGDLKFYLALGMSPLCPVFLLENLGFFRFFEKNGIFDSEKVFFGNSISTKILNRH